MILQLGSFTGDMATALSMLSANWMFVLLGVLAGMTFGVIPGMGGTVTLTILLPFTIGMNSVSAFVLFGSALGATSFSGSLTAILVNTPGSGSNAATLLDGYPLTQQGKAGTAIGASAVASATGAIMGLIIFLLLIPVVIEVALLFGPSELFWLVTIGLIVLPLLAGDRILAGLAAGSLGLLFAFTGPALRTGEYRFTHQLPLLFDGIDLVPAIVGLFAVAEMLKLSSQDRNVIDSTAKTIGNKFDGVRAVIEHKWLWLRCSIIGLIIGAIPGVGGTVANFVAYGHAVQTSPNPETFGEGRIEGVIASEAANDAKDGGQLFPTLGLGIPGSGSTAILLSGFLIHGIQPGPSLLQEELPLMLVIVFALLVSNILTSIIGLTFTKPFSKIAEVPIEILSPTIIVLSLMSVFVMRNHFPDLYLAIFFGLLGVTLMYFNIGRIPIIIALVLGDIFEDNFWLALQLANENFVNGFLTGWLNQVLILLLVITILFPLRKPIQGVLANKA